MTRAILLSIILALSSTALAQPATAQATAAAPATKPYPVDTISCRDGTMAILPMKQGTCAQHGGVGAAAPTTAIAHEPVYSAAETCRFKALAKQTILALDAHKKGQMIAKLTDLETIWDEKQSVLSPKDPETWTVIDKALDRGISALRSSKTDLPKGKAALQDFIKNLDRATKH
jgi:hypothetical protein